MQITITGSRATHALVHDGTRRVLMLGTRLAQHDLFEWCRRLVQRSGDVLQLVPFAAAGLRRAWSASGTLAALNARWHLVLMIEDTPRIAAEPQRYASIARVLSFAARSSGARVALVQPPPWTGDMDDWVRTRDAVAAAAGAAHAEVVPVGEAWRRARSRHPELPLCGVDGRVTGLGAYLAARVLARYVVEDDVEDMELPGVPRGWIGAIHRVVEEAVAGGRGLRCEAQEGVRP